MKEVILIKIGEIVLKGLNRKNFEDRLIKTIRERILPLGNFEIINFPFKCLYVRQSFYSNSDLPN